MTAVVGLLAILAAFSLGSVRERLFRRSSSREIQSVAVLPLDNLSGDPAQDYFADGMTDAITQSRKTLSPTGEGMDGQSSSDRKK